MMLQDNWVQRSLEVFAEVQYPAGFRSAMKIQTQFIDICPNLCWTFVVLPDPKKYWFSVLSVLLY